MTFRLFKVHSTSNGLFNYTSLHPWYKILARSCYSTMVWFQKIKFLKEIFYDLLSPDMALITENFRRCASWKIRQHMSITMIDDKTITMFYVFGHSLQVKLTLWRWCLNENMMQYPDVTILRRFRKSSWNECTIFGFSKRLGFGLGQIECPLSLCPIRTRYIQIWEVRFALKLLNYW